ncbi:hypothetical protein ACEPAG_5227 [Sanghuangporus baumii]
MLVLRSPISATALSLHLPHPRIMSISYAEAAALRKAAQRAGRPRTLRPRSTAPEAGSLHREQPDPIQFSRVAKPGAYYERPRIKRDLPTVTSPWIGLAAFGLVGVAGWGAFLAYTTNQERLSSSVVRQILQNLRTSSLVREVLGDGVRPEPAWFLNGEPWVNGSINMLQGNVDFSMRVKGSKGAGTLYFTSIRREKGSAFEILRYKIICDDKTVINLPTSVSP